VQAPGGTAVNAIDLDMDSDVTVGEVDKEYEELLKVDMVSLSRDQTVRLKVCFHLLAAWVRGTKWQTERLGLQSPGVSATRFR
jgi:hypothetical protein